MAAYFAMVEHMDAAIGRIVQALDDKGIRDNSLVLFMSDNGGPDIGSVNGPLRGGKGVSYEGGIRAPFFMNCPGCLGVSPSQLPVINSEAFNMVDLYNTLLSLSPNSDLSSNIESRSVFNQFTEATGVIRYGNRYEEDFFRASEVPIEKRGRSSAYMAAMSPFNIAAIYDNFKLVLSRKE
jgi:arylsulfatase A-like enzyme